MGIINFGKSEKKISIGFSQKKKKKTYRELMALCYRIGAQRGTQNLVRLENVFNLCE